MYGERWAEPSFNAIAFYLHVAGYLTFERANCRCTRERWILNLDCVSIDTENIIYYNSNESLKPFPNLICFLIPFWTMLAPPCQYMTRYQGSLHS